MKKKIAPFSDEKFDPSVRDEKKNEVIELNELFLANWPTWILSFYSKQSMGDLFPIFGAF